MIRALTQTYLGLQNNVPMIDAPTTMLEIESNIEGVLTLWDMKHQEWANTTKKQDYHFLRWISIVAMHEDLPIVARLRFQSFVRARS